MRAGWLVNEWMAPVSVRTYVVLVGFDCCDVANYVRILGTYW